MPPIGKRGGLVILYLLAPQIHSSLSLCPGSLTLMNGITEAPSPMTSCWGQPVGGTSWRLECGRREVGALLSLPTPCFGLRLCQWLQ